MSFVDFEKVQVNSGGDQALLLELITMGLERIDGSLTEMDDQVSKKDWIELSKTIHKLRPILCYAGIESFNEELIGLEMAAREGTGIDMIPARISKISGDLHLARCELENLLSELRK
jgi:HPt (histidine-containing phosphotransfer) domain-containing protein